MRETIDTLKEKIEKKEFNRKISRIPQKLEKYLRPKTKGKDRQINMARPINLIKALVITVKIRDTRVRILIDSGCLNNFVSFDFVKKV
jgi:hypothetical protein